MPKDNHYYWTHDDEYVRLTANDLNGPAVVNLLEMVLSEMRQEMDCLARKCASSPYNKDYKDQAKMMMRNSQSEFINGITFGHGEELAEDFAKRCDIGSV